MPRFQHQRHKPPRHLAADRPLILVCPAMRSRVNLSRIVRLAGCFGVRHVIACRPFAIDPGIARDAADYVHVESRGSLPPVLKRLKQQNYRIVGLEQSTGSRCLYDYRFVQRTALLIGHERQGIPEQELELVEDVVEIPVYGQPLSFNVATAVTMAVYEYCRQFPDG
jgi:tRNA G18 (ribose-2'-O)-methylase SpoU